MEPDRRSVLKSVGATVATIGGMSTTVSAEEFVSTGSEVDLVEASLGFYPTEDRSFPHFDQIPSYGVDPDDSTLYLFSADQEQIDTIISYEQAVLSDGVKKLPGEIFNRTSLKEAPIYDGESQPNKFVSLSSNYHFPAVTGRFTSNSDLQVSFGTKKRVVKKGREAEIILDTHDVTTVNSNVISVKPAMKFKNHGQVSVNHLNPNQA